MQTLIARLRILGILLIAAGLTVTGTGLAYGLPMANDGLESAQAMYEAQGVTLSYDGAGRLVDRGTTDGAAKILALLEDEWKYPVDHANLDPRDPIVNTWDELMYQYAVITYHVLHGPVDVTLTAEQVPITYRDVTYTEPGVYPIAPMKYYGELDRTHPIEGQLRGAWSPLAIALVGSLAAGHANQAAGELAQAMSLAVAALGGLFVLAGAGLVWTTFARSSGATTKTQTPASPVSARPTRRPLGVAGR